MRPATLTLALVALVALSGCPRPWTGARTAVSAAAHGVTAADAATAAAYEQSPCSATEDVDELRQCVERLREVSRGLELARAAVLEGESLVDLWEQGGTAPEDWRAWLAGGAQAVLRLPALLQAAGVPLPAELVNGARLLDELLELRRTP